MKYIYTIWAALTFIICFLIVFPFILLFLLFGNLGRKWTFYLTKIWAHTWFFLIGMYTKKIYEAPLDKERKYIVTANHSSYIDTPLIFRGLPFMVRPLAKFELGKIPLFGILYRQMAVTIDRSSTASKSKGVQQLKKSLQEEGSIFIFPEGTFDEHNDILKPFFDGAFRIAIQTQTPILPVLFLDTAKRWHPSSFWNMSPGVNRVVFMEPIEVSDYQQEDVKALKAVVYSRMQACLEKYRNNGK